MEGTQMAVVSQDGTLQRILPCPVPAGERHRLRGARRAAIIPPAHLGPVTVQRRVSSRGSIMVATQKIQVGMIHAGKVVTVTACDHSFQVGLDHETIAVVHDHRRDPPIQGLRESPSTTFRLVNQPLC